MQGKIALGVLLALVVAGCDTPQKTADQPAPPAADQQSYSKTHPYQTTGSRLGRSTPDQGPDVQSGSATDMLRNPSPH